MAEEQIVNHQVWNRIGDLYNLFNGHAALQTKQESRDALNLASTRLLDLAKKAVNGTYGEIEGRPATLEEALTQVLKPLETVGSVAKNNFNQAAGDAFDDIRLRYDGPAVMGEFRKLHDDAVAATAPRPK